MSIGLDYLDGSTPLDGGFGASYPPSILKPGTPATPATDATAGSPGSFNGAVPADKAALDAITPSVATAWADDEWVVLADATTFGWDGAAWAAVNPGPVVEAVAGTPGALNNANGDPVGDPWLPADLAALQALGALGNTTAWTTGESVTLGDASDAHWDGTTWSVDVAPAPPPPPLPGPDMGWTVAELDQFAADHEPPIHLPSDASKSEKVDIIAAYLAAHPDD